MLGAFVFDYKFRQKMLPLRFRTPFFFQKLLILRFEKFFALNFGCNKKGQNYHLAGHTSIPSSHLMTCMHPLLMSVMRFALLGDFIIQALSFFTGILAWDAQIQEPQPTWSTSSADALPLECKCLKSPLGIRCRQRILLPFN